MYKVLAKVICSVLVIIGIFGFIDTFHPAKAETGAIQTFETSYKGYNTRTSWRSSLTMADRCTDTQKIYGARPVAAGNYPVLLYVHGTYADWGNNKEGREFVKRAASLGYVAMALTYSSGSSLNDAGLQRHAYCMFDQNHGKDGLTAACAVSGANCSNGVVLTGFSQGAAIAAIAKNYNESVKAVWGIGLSAYIYPSHTVPTNALPSPYGTRVLPSDKLVINMGQASNLFKKDLIAEDLPSLKQLTGVDCAGDYRCLQSNGSGYYVVANTEVADGTADHAYWMQVNKFSKGSLSFTLSPKKFDPGFDLPAATDWSLARNLNWLKSQY